MEQVTLELRWAREAYFAAPAAERGRILNVIVALVEERTNTPRGRE
jgi:hypothetical protein